jgi:hypothetical protein
MFDTRPGGDMRCEMSRASIQCTLFTGLRQLAQRLPD